MNNPKPSLKANPRFPDPNSQKLSYGNVLIENIDGVPVYLLENERPFNKPSSTLHMGPHLQKQREEADPKLKAVGSEISKKVSEIRIRDSDLTPFDEENDSPIIIKPGKKLVEGQKSNEIMPKVLTQDDIRKGERFPFVSSEGNPQQNAKEQDERLLKEKEELRQQLENTKKELEQAREALKKSSNNEGGTHKGELSELDQEKGKLAMQLKRADEVYDESIKIVESLLEQIKNHLLAELKFYEKIQEKMETGDDLQTQKKGQEGDKEKEWMEMQYIIFGMRRECDELLKKLREKAWTKPEIEEAKEFIIKMQENSTIKTENSKLKAEDKKNKSVIHKLENYIKELEEQVNNLGNDSKNANKNNIMKVLQLTKDLKSNGLKEAEMTQDIENMRTQIEGLRAEMEGKESSEKKYKDQANKKVEELTQQIIEREDIMAQVQEQMIKLLKRNQLMKEKIDSHQEEIDSVRVQLNHYKEKEINMYSTTGTPQTLKHKGKSAQSSIGSLTDLKVDMEWLKVRVGETTDWMMMLHVQALALEDSLKRNEQLEKLERMASPQRLISPHFVKNDGTGQETNSRFSFGQYLGFK